MSISSTYELYKEIFRPEVGNFNPTRTLYTVCFQWIGDAVYKAELDEKITLMINQDGYQVIESTPDNSRMEIRTKLMNLNRENTRDKHYVLLLDLQQPHAVTADSLKNLLGAVWSERSVQDRMTVIIVLPDAPDAAALDSDIRQVLYSSNLKPGVYLFNNINGLQGNLTDSIIGVMLLLSSKDMGCEIDSKSRRYNTEINNYVESLPAATEIKSGIPLSWRTLSCIFYNQRLDVVEDCVNRMINKALLPDYEQFKAVISTIACGDFFELSQDEIISKLTVAIKRIPMVNWGGEEEQSGSVFIDLLGGSGMEAVDLTMKMTLSMMRNPTNENTVRLVTKEMLEKFVPYGAADFYQTIQSLLTQHIKLLKQDIDKTRQYMDRYRNVSPNYTQSASQMIHQLAKEYYDYYRRQREYSFWSSVQRYIGYDKDMIRRVYGEPARQIYEQVSQLRTKLNMRTHADVMENASLDGLTYGHILNVPNDMKLQEVIRQISEQKKTQSSNITPRRDLVFSMNTLIGMTTSEEVTISTHDLTYKAKAVHTYGTYLFFREDDTVDF